MIFVFALKMLASGQFGYNFWENGLIRVCYQVIPEPFLTTEKNQCIVNAVIPSTALPDITGWTSSQEMITAPVLSVVGRGYQLWSLKQQKRKNIFFQANNSPQKTILQFLKSFDVYFKIIFGNPAICPNIEIHQLFQVGVRQAKTSEGAPMPAVLLCLGYSQTPLTQFSCSCVLTVFSAANHL